MGTFIYRLEHGVRPGAAPSPESCPRLQLLVPVRAVCAVAPLAGHSSKVGAGLDHVVVHHGAVGGTAGCKVRHSLPAGRKQLKGMPLCLLN